eukprot:m.29833 g.29833  ORF g.29833 m.29833 type:complete len:523 (+) comp14416_c0_seq1:3-1571(+)
MTTNREYLEREVARDLEQRQHQKEAPKDQPEDATAPPSQPKPDPAIKQGIAAGNINISAPTSASTTGLSDTAKMEVDRHESLLAEFERRKQARNIAVPTDDNLVKARLRDLEEPITLFGEDAADRRDRLKDLLSRLGDDERAKLASSTITSLPQKQEETKELWYHEGPDELKLARLFLAQYSIPRAKARLAQARQKRAEEDESQAGIRTQQLHATLKNFQNTCSQVGDARPASFCRLSPDASMLATGSWRGACKVWSIPNCELKLNLRGHTDRIGNVVWHPEATKTAHPSSTNLASCSSDGLVHLWSLEKDTPLHTLRPQGGRIPRVAFHPSGRFLANTCYDKSWRLWDLDTCKELLHQEGHSRPVYSCSFHPDGSLIGTASLDALPRLWDLRSGRCVLILQGHVKQVLAIDFSPNGHLLATGSEDHSLRLWDIRRMDKACIYTLPAHTNLVTDVRFQQSAGEYLVSSSFDRTAKVWAVPTMTPLKTLQGHEDKVMSVDISADEGTIATASYDRTFKLWSAE